MQELEKILEEIEQKIEKAEKIIVKPAHDKLDEVANDTAEAFIEAYKECQDIIRKYMENDGWIPVKERLPEEEGFYIATMDGEIAGQEESFIGLSEFENGLWIDDDIDYKCIIAWRPLPEPYRPERSKE